MAILQNAGVDWCIGAEVPHSSKSTQVLLFWLQSAGQSLLKPNFYLNKKNSIWVNPIMSMVVFHGCGRAPSTVKISRLGPVAVPTSWPGGIIENDKLLSAMSTQQSKSGNPNCFPEKVLANR